MSSPQERAVIAAAIRWRRDWFDAGDENEMRGGCKCPPCELGRAVFAYLAVEHAKAADPKASRSESE